MPGSDRPDTPALAHDWWLPQRHGAPITCSKLSASGTASLRYSASSPRPHPKHGLFSTHMLDTTSLSGLQHLRPTCFASERCTASEAEASRSASSAWEAFQASTLSNRSSRALCRAATSAASPSRSKTLAGSAAGACARCLERLVCLWGPVTLQRSGARGPLRLEMPGCVPVGGLETCRALRSGVCVSSCEGFSSVASTASMHGAVNPGCLAARGSQGPNKLKNGSAPLSALHHQTCTPAATNSEAANLVPCQALPGKAQGLGCDKAHEAQTQSHLQGIFGLGAPQPVCQVSCRCLGGAQAPAHDAGWHHGSPLHCLLGVRKAGLDPSRSLHRRVCLVRSAEQPAVEACGR